MGCRGGLEGGEVVSVKEVSERTQPFSQGLSLALESLEQFSDGIRAGPSEQLWCMIAPSGHWLIKKWISLAVLSGYLKVGEGNYFSEEVLMGLIF